MVSRVIPVNVFDLVVFGAAVAGTGHGGHDRGVPEAIAQLGQGDRQRPVHQAFHLQAEGTGVDDGVGSVAADIEVFDRRDPRAEFRAQDRRE